MRAISIFNVRGVSSRSLRMAFDLVRDTLGFEEVTEPFFGPEDGSAFLRKKNYSFQLSYYWPTSELTVYYYGDISADEIELIKGVLGKASFPLEP